MALFDRPALLAGAGAAAAGWGIVAVPVLLLWVATPYADGDLTAVPKLAAALWLLGHGGPLRWDGPAGHATLGVAPLLLTALAAGLVQHAAARTGRRVAVVVGYLGVALLAALLGLGSAPRTEPLPDLLWTALVAVLAAMAGAHRSTGEWGLTAAWRAVRARGEWLGIWPVPAPGGVLARRLEQARVLAPRRDVALRAGLAGALTLLGGGAVVFGVSMLAHLGAAGTLASLLAPDLVGRLSLLLLCVVLLPNAVVWATGYGLGTGFALGGHAAALGTQSLAPVALPLVAYAPAPGRSLLGLGALAVPIAAGVVVGRALTREEPPGTATGAAPEAGTTAGAPGTAVGEPEEASAGPRSARALAACVVGASAGTGLLAGAAAFWAGGALGDAALAEVGPPVGWTALAAFTWTLVVALPTAFLLRGLRTRTWPLPSVADGRLLLRRLRTRARRLPAGADPLDLSLDHGFDLDAASARDLAPSHAARPGTGPDTGRNAAPGHDAVLGHDAAPGHDAALGRGPVQDPARDPARDRAPAPVFDFDALLADFDLTPEPALGPGSDATAGTNPASGAAPSVN